MIRPLKSVSTGSLVLLLLTAPVLISGIPSSKREDTTVASTPVSISKVAKSVKELIFDEAMVMYNNMNLRRYGLTAKAFQFAWQGYKYLVDKGSINNKTVLSICDFSQSSRRKRLYVIDVEEMKVLVNTYVAHGRNSGGEYARSFSNNPESHKSSLGFYVTGSSYYGGHGLALNIEGMERGINDKADARNIVVHGSKYVGPNFLRFNRFNGRSYGCPAVPAKDTDKIINTIKDGSCLFIYHPTKHYLQKSKILNG